MLKSARKQEKDDEGRMPLLDHLRELRNRLLKAVLAIVVVTIVAAFFQKDIYDFLLRPLLESVGCKDGVVVAVNGKPCALLKTNTLLAPFTNALKVALMSGVLLATPVWLYQLWAFVAPGLHQGEKRYAYAFAVVGAPSSSPAATSRTRFCRRPPRSCSGSAPRTCRTRSSSTVIWICWSAW